MSKFLLFLSGLPRSGSTLLGSILSQHPEIHVTPTSPLSDLLCLIDENFSKLDVQYTYNKSDIVSNTYSSILNNFYNHIEKRYVIDKHRAWPRNVNSLKAFLGKEPKILCTNRRISEIISSYINLIEKNNQANNFVDQHLISIGKEINTDNRVECLWEYYISDPYKSTVFGLTHFKNNIHLINYNDLIDNPENEIEKIYKFLEITPHKHDFKNILNTCAEEKDSAWGLENLHIIRSKLGRTNRPPEEVIGIENTILYDKFNL
jgi:sulfotransferase